MHQRNLRSQDVGNVSLTSDVLNLVQILSGAFKFVFLRDRTVQRGALLKVFEKLVACELVCRESSEIPHEPLFGVEWFDSVAQKPDFSKVGDQSTEHDAAKFFHAWCTHDQSAPVFT
jgi:hypothetical protein